MARMKCHVVLPSHSPDISFSQCCSGHSLMSLVGNGTPSEKPRCALDGEELLETLLDFCEGAAGISSVVFHRTDFDPSVLSW